MDRKFYWSFSLNTNIPADVVKFQNGPWTAHFQFRLHSLIKQNIRQEKGELQQDRIWDTRSKLPENQQFDQDS